MSHTHAEPATGEAIEDRTLGELMALVSRDVSHLVRSEIDLAKAEVAADAKRGAVSGGLFGAAAFLGYFALLFLSVAAALAIGLVLPTVLGFLIIGGAYLLATLLFAWLGAGNLRRLNKARRTLRSIRATVALVKRSESETAQ